MVSRKKQSKLFSESEDTLSLYFTPKLSKLIHKDFICAKGDVRMVYEKNAA